MKSSRSMICLLLVGLALGGGVLLFFKHSSTYFGPRLSSQSYYTCSLCGSTRSTDCRYLLGYIPWKKTETIIYKSPGFSSCTHAWVTGISYSPPKPVPNNVVVLIRENGRYGAFILRRQTVSPERAEYDWWYRPDGGSLLGTNQPVVTSGQGSTPKIQFGPFSLSWSIHSNSSGWLMYKHGAGDPISPQDLHLCITERDSVEGLDAALPEWQYKATP